MREDEKIFDIIQLERELDAAEIYGEQGEKVQSVYLGTVFSLLPSGKYYTPWGCSNVEVCETCAKAIDGPCDSTSPCKNPKPAPDAQDYESEVEYQEALADWEDYHCEVCQDCAWRQQAEAELERIHAFLTEGEGDPCDLYATRCVEDEEDQDEE